ncbi:hypothetical protein CFP65_5996 [Kitasatospora sp. MMS16-BH015]|uniref:TetR/AcrR family transcriptional regulator n=1 Tax=Kitasatospora sp. MMS16-BH015 TaxID=2018025 RepID=UPI000CA29476|nr:TetR/AcrR family transcriptional regulator [Kitasatospora sp. MMS16-BH015]AUG80670.1 hypothetical protein CFP65_5996 [Kitasatospora sp. MMS16-BH015]
MTDLPAAEAVETTAEAVGSAAETAADAAAETVAGAAAETIAGAAADASAESSAGTAARTTAADAAAAGTAAAGTAAAGTAAADTAERPAEPVAKPARRRDSARSRELLLAAARQLFTERGYDRTTTREIGELAGVDPTLIARYYGGKTQLYIAALNAEFGSTPPADLLDRDRLRWLLDQVGRRGPGPGFRVASTPYQDPEVQQAAQSQLHFRLVDPLRERFRRDGLDDPQLRAELAVAAFAGILMGRSSGAFPTLTEADPAELVALVYELLSPADGS